MPVSVESTLPSKLRINIPLISVIAMTRENFEKKIKSGGPTKKNTADPTNKRFMKNYEQTNKQTRKQHTSRFLPKIIRKG